MSILQPAYAFKANNRRTGGWVQFYFDGNDQLVEMREFDAEGDVIRRAGYLGSIEEDEDDGGEEVYEGDAYASPQDNPYVRAQINKAMLALTAPENMAEAAFEDVFQNALEEEFTAPGSMRSHFAKIWDKKSPEFNKPWAKKWRRGYAAEYGLNQQKAAKGDRVAVNSKAAKDKRRKKRANRRFATSKLLKNIPGGKAKAKKKGKKTESVQEAIPGGTAGRKGAFAAAWDRTHPDFDDYADFRADWAEEHGMNPELARGEGLRQLKKKNLKKKKKKKKGKKGKKAESYFQDEIGRLETENNTLRSLISEMAAKHKLDVILREHPELRRLESRLSEIRDVEVLEAEANALVHAIQEASGSPISVPETPRVVDGARSASVPNAPTGPLNEDHNTSLVSNLNESDDPFTRARAHRQRQRETSQARASSLGE